MSQGSQAEAAPTAVVNVAPSPWGPARLKLLAIILTIGGVLEVIAWNAMAPNRTYQVFASWPIISALLLAVFLWGLLGGGFRISALWRRALTIAAVAGLFFGCLRFEGFDGDVIPRYRPRWAPTPEERLKTFIAAEEKQFEAELAKFDSETVETGGPETITSGHFRSSLDPLGTDQFDWVSYRGPQRDGVARVDHAVDWTLPPTEVWRHPVGAGWSSFCVVDGFAFTQEQRDEHEAVVCYNLQTGATVWTHQDQARFNEAMGGPGPRATPTFADGRLYTLGATGLLTCFDNPRTNKVLWQRNILTDALAANIEWAMSGSPLVVDGKVIVVPGGPNGRGVIAYDAVTGKEVWAAGNGPASYAAPKLAKLSDQQTVLVFDGLGLRGHDVATGKELWNLPWTNQPKVNAVEPVVLDDQTLLIGGGYNLGGALVKVIRDGDSWSAKTEWTSRRFHLKFNAPVVKDGYAYGLDEGILECIDVKTGDLKWKKGRYGYGQLLLVDDVVIVMAESGEVACVKAIPERYEELQRFPALNGKTWNHPVVWHDFLLLRNSEEAACFKLKLKD